MPYVGPSAVTQAYGSAVQFRVLGPLRVSAGDRELQPGGPKQRSVLALLLAGANRPVSIDGIIDGVWGADPPEAGRHTIQAYISSLRSDLGLTVERVGDAYRLEVEPPDFDVTRFETLLEEARRLRPADPARASDLLVKALGEWQGRPYADLPHQEIFQTEIARLDELRLTALEERIEADLGVGRHAAIVGELEVLTREHPFREKLYALLMLSLYRSGRQAEALRAYGRLREVLAEELGIDPSQSLQELENQILRQDPALELPPPMERTETVALLFTDFEASTALWEAQPAAMGDLISEHDRLLAQLVDEQRGRVFKQVGDGALVAFATVGQAVAVAEGIQRALLDRISSMRMGIDIGEVEARGDDYFGSPLNRCARLLAAAHGGQVLLSEEVASHLTSERVLDLGEHRFKGVGRPMRVYQLATDGLKSDFPELRVADTETRLERSGFGRTIRGFELRELIGEGDFGVVYRAYQASVGREVAIKVIRPEYANRPVFVRRFEAEARLVAQLEHPHIVSLYDYWRDPDGAYLVMRYLRGGSLRTALTRGSWNLPAALTVLDQVGSALAYAHRQGVVHRDLKPGNVLLDEEGRAYLTDFGIATRQPDAVGGPVTTSLAYVPPEELRGEPITARTDIYSLGVLALELLTGYRAAGEQLPPIRDLRADLPAALDEVVSRATADRPAHRFEQVEDFLRALRQAAGIDVVGAAETAIDATSSKPLRNPYKGLRAFQETDAPDFFGRDALIDRLVEAVRSHRLVVVVGPSGSGKSSVVRAGLLPALRAGAIQGSSDWLVAEMFPGTHPFEELETALLRVAVHRPERMIDELTADERGLLRVVKQILPTDDTQLVLVIDQFEELFSMVAGEEVRRLFLDSLVALCADGRGRARVVATLRADFFHRPLDYSEFGSLLEAGLVPLTALDHDGLALSISRPARSVGLELEPGLVSEIVSDVSGQPGGLPLMQHALTELFQRRRESVLTIEGYRATGGVLGALGRRAEEIHESLSESGRTAARQLFLRLVTVDEQADDTRRRVRQSELGSLDIDHVALDEAIAQFGAHRLLSFDRDPITRSATVEVAHEALLREWQRLRRWIDERREDLVLHRRLGAAIQEWRDSEEKASYLLEGGRLEQFETWARDTEMALSADENRFLAESRAAYASAVQRRRRRRRAILAGFGAAAVISVLLAVVAFIQRGEAGRSTALAEARQIILEADKALTTDPELSMLLSLEAIEAFRAAGAEPPPSAIGALRQGLNESVVDMRIPGGGMVAVSADGAYLATAGKDGGVAVWDLATREVVQNLVRPGGWEFGAAFDVSGDLLVVGYEGVPRPLRIWEWRTGSYVDLGGEAPLPEGYFDFMRIDQERGLATIRRGPPHSGFEVWDFNGDELLHIVGSGPDAPAPSFLPSGRPNAPAPSFFADGRLAFLEIPEEGWVIRIVDSITGEPLDSVAVDWGEHIPFPPSTLSVSPEGSRAVIAGQEKVALALIDLESGEVRWVNDRLTRAFDAMWLPDGERLFVGGATAPSVLDASDGVVVRQLQGGVRGGVFHSSPIPGTNLVAAAGNEPETVVFDLTPVRSDYSTLSSAFPEVTEVMFVGDGDMLAVSDGDSNALIDAETGAIVDHRAGRDPMEGTGYPIFSGGGRYTAGPDAEGRSILWSNQDQGVAYMSPPGWQVRGVSDDGSLAVIVSEADRYSTRLIHTGDETVIADLDIGGNFMPEAIFSADGTLVLTNNFLLKRIWETSTGSLVREFEMPGWDQRFTPDGNTLVVGGADGTIYVFDVGGLLGGFPTEETMIRQIPAHNNFITVIRISPDGSVILSRAHDEPLKLWDLETGEKLGEFGSIDPMFGAFHPIEPLLYLPLSGDEIGIYTLDVDELIEIARSRLTRELTGEECQLYLRRSCDEGN